MSTSEISSTRKCNKKDPPQKKVIPHKKNKSKRLLPTTNIKRCVTPDCELTSLSTLSGQFSGKMPAGDMQHTNLPLDHSDVHYWGDDELDVEEEDFDILSPRPTLRVHLTEYQGGIGAYCVHCGITPVRAFTRYCTQCRQNRQEWLPRVRRRRLRRKVYRNGHRIRNHPQCYNVQETLAPKRGSQSLAKHQTMKRKISSVFKKKFRSLVRYRSKSLETTSYQSVRTNDSANVRRQREGSTDTDSEWAVLDAKSKAFRLRRDNHFYKRHRYESDWSKLSNQSSE